MHARRPPSKKPFARSRAGVSALSYDIFVVCAGTVPSEKWPFVQSWRSRIPSCSTNGESTGYKPPSFYEVLTSYSDQPRHVPRLTALESQLRLIQLITHATHGSKEKCILLYTKGRSAQPGVLWRTHHTKPDSKPMRVMSFCLCEVYTRVDLADFRGPRVRCARSTPRSPSALARLLSPYWPESRVIVRIPRDLN
jgi:hypothetical protein